ncbi:hypothetical protein LZ32DRAFT_659790 [Colletotrichum eremochloae]|nr:hypothetical protein LZ32DRAFT_659790 [Colletotrichum eremochloae]
MATECETVVEFRSVTPRTFSPDPDTHRGRKRDRSLTRCDLEATHYGGTGESSTLRGRPRRRSTSPIGDGARAPPGPGLPITSRPRADAVIEHGAEAGPIPRRWMYQVKGQLPRPIQEPLHMKGSKSAQD